MANKYRVDRNACALGVSVPCGMNSLLYLGDNALEARKAFDVAEPGLDSWGRPNATFGVTMAVWNGENYIVKCKKGGI